MLSENNPLLKYQVKFWRESIEPTINQALELVPKDKLNWAPADRMITLGNIFLHISECSDWWYEDVMKGNSATELAKAPCPPKDKIAGYLEIHWKRLERLFAESPQVLDKVYKIEHQKKIHSLDGYWIFTHLLEHDLHHRSQINQYLRILHISPPKI